MEVLDVDRRQYPCSIYEVKDYSASEIRRMNETRRMKNHKTVHEPNEENLVDSGEQILDDPVPWARPHVTEVSPYKGA